MAGSIYAWGDGHAREEVNEGDDFEEKMAGYYLLIEFAVGNYRNFDALHVEIWKVHSLSNI